MNRFKDLLRHHPSRPTMNRTIIFSLFLILLSACPGWGATYYVKAGGNDSLDGLSDATAWATISKVETTVVSGDIVYFRSQDTWSGAAPILVATAGVTYDGTTYGSGSGALFSSTRDYAGSYSQGGVIEINASNVTVTGFRVNGNNHISHGVSVGFYVTGGVSNVTLDYLNVYNISNGSDANHECGITVMPIQSDSGTTSNIAITNSTVHDVYWEGIVLYPTWKYTGVKLNTALIRNCVVYNTGLGQVSGSGYGIYVKDDVSNATIEFCTVHDAYDNGLTAEVIDDVTIGIIHNLVVRYNMIYNNGITGIALLETNSGGRTWDASFYGNLIFNNGKSPNATASDIGPNSNNYGSSVFNFYNNTIFNTASTASETHNVWIGGMTGTPTLNFKNNIVYSAAWTPVRDYTGNLTSPMHSNNLIFRSDSASDEHVYSNGTSYNRAGVLAWEPGDTGYTPGSDPTFTGGTLPTGFSGNPGTVSLVSGQWVVTGSSMIPNTNYFAITSGNALNRGAILGSPYDGCINGAGLATPLLRPAGTYDIGAYQYVTVNGLTSLAAPTGLRIIAP